MTGYAWMSPLSVADWRGQSRERLPFAIATSRLHRFSGDLKAASFDASTADDDTMIELAEKMVEMVMSRIPSGPISTSSARRLASRSVRHPSAAAEPETGQHPVASRGSKGRRRLHGARPLPALADYSNTGVQSRPAMARQGTPRPTPASSRPVGARPGAPGIMSAWMSLLSGERRAGLAFAAPPNRRRSVLRKMTSRSCALLRGTG